MSLPIIRRPSARADLVDAFAYLGGDDPRVGHRFFEAAEATFAEIAAMPGIGGLYPVRNSKLAGLRRTSISGFKKYQVFYLTNEGSVEIIRVLHGATDLRSILGRDS